jgi:formylmethanofuran dehydrogenase subunit C
MAKNTTARAWKANRDSVAGIFLDDQKVIIAGDNKHFLAADNRGITIKGPISFASMSNEQRSGGLFVGRGEFIDMIPATIVTLNPRKTPFPPITGIADVVADVAFFMMLLG